LRAEIEGQKARLAGIERDRDAHAVTLARVEKEAVDLRAALLEAERQTKETEAAAALVENKLAQLRDALAQAEQHGQREAARADRAAVEIAELNAALAAARKVGKAAIMALTKDPSPTVCNDPPLGWRQAIRRMLRVDSAQSLK